MTTVIILQVVLSLIIGSALGAKRRIGEGWSLFFCLTLSVLFGIFVVLSSPLKTDPASYVNKKQPIGIIIFAVLLGLAGLVLFYNSIMLTQDKILLDETKRTMIYGIAISIGLVGLCIYLIYPPRLRKKD